LLCVLLAVPALCGKVDGVKADDSVTVGGKALALNGQGLRSKTHFKDGHHHIGRREELHRRRQGLRWRNVRGVAGPVAGGRESEEGPHGRVTVGL
jgi:hypothetical protein